ncbi:hypothetical protein GQ53DRAFT_768937 [Thozetella sp. PMI_491]|nr:hypothetical protein GQ53DRAFT_768937 [Thozetella sp. PMI_491]
MLASRCEQRGLEALYPYEFSWKECPWREGFRDVRDQGYHRDTKDPRKSSESHMWFLRDDECWGRRKKPRHGLADAGLSLGPRRISGTKRDKGVSRRLAQKPDLAVRGRDPRYGAAFPEPGSTPDFRDVGERRGGGRLGSHNAEIRVSRKSVAHMAPRMAPVTNYALISLRS